MFPRFLSNLPLSGMNFSTRVVFFGWKAEAEREESLDPVPPDEKKSRVKTHPGP